jgi:hypothetical protein
MSRKSKASFAVIVVLAVAIVTPHTGWGQEMRTLEVSDGVVRLDGKELAPESLPESLRDTEVDLVFSWTGSSEPVIEIEDRLYIIDAEGLREVDAHVYQSARQRYFEALGSVGEGMWYSTGVDDPATQRQMQALYVQAREMTELSKQLEHKRMEDADRLAQEMRKQAEMAQRMAVEIPRMNVTTYWDAVRESDESLYDQLVEEWNLESRIQALAAKARSLSQGSERERMVHELRSLLGAAFELKQENRRREIDQLEDELKTLQHRLQERESLRAKIIERRLNELIGRDG